MVQTAGRSRTWRPFGYWALTLNVSFIPLFVIAGPLLSPRIDTISVEMLTDLYPAMLACWAAAAAVRQWGKIKGAET